MTLSAGLLPGLPLIESPLFKQSLDEMGLSPEEREIALQLHERGYAVIDFPDEQVDARIDRIKASLRPLYKADLLDPESIKNEGDMRIQDAWKFNDDVRTIASNPAILELLSRLYGRRAFPFQTLNFPVGTQQHMHSDSIHFSSIPERFMCGVWLALEDIGENAGPLLYYPGSHKWPILTNEMLGRTIDRASGAQEPYEAVWRALVEANGIEPETFCARKGQALIWTANLLHGGSRQNDPTLTRWSQVTHYYFENCTYYTPAYSLASIGKLDIRSIEAIDTQSPVENRFLGRSLADHQPNLKPRQRGRYRRALGKIFARKSTEGLPNDFDPDRYYQLNRDVAEAGDDAAQHYLRHGRFEQRRYR